MIDAALGVIERGTYRVADAIAEQPWLPNGPIPFDVQWTHPEYTRQTGSVTELLPSPAERKPASNRDLDRSL